MVLSLSLGAFFASQGATPKHKKNGVFRPFSKGAELGISEQRGVLSLFSKMKVGR